MTSQLQTYCDSLPPEFYLISKERKVLLEKIAGYINTKLKEKKKVNLVFICTHNSRRSHFGQVWASVAGHYYNVRDISTYSGGTEATAFNPNAIGALTRAGFIIRKITSEPNPHYHVVCDESQKAVVCFSKLYDQPPNPGTNFAAIMTCSEAEENCPFIPGAELRIGTTYNDPKVFDNTPQQDEKYDERCREIAREVFFVFSLVNFN